MNENSRATISVMSALAIAALMLLSFGSLSPRASENLTLGVGPFAKTPVAAGAVAFSNTNSLDLEQTDVDYLSMTEANFGDLVTLTRFTVNFWVKPESFSSSRNGIFAQWGFSGSRRFGFFIENVGGDLAHYWSPNGSAQSNIIQTTGLTTGQWVQVTWQIDTATPMSPTVKLFTNGVEVTVFTSANYPGNSVTYSDEAGAIEWGRMNQLGVTYDGLIDEVSVVTNRIAAPSEFADGSSKPIDISAVAGLHSWNRCGDGGDMTADEVLVAAWSTNANPVLSADVP